MISNQTSAYTFTTIADTTNFSTFEFTLGDFGSPTAPAINAAGEVAFWGMTRDSEAGVFVGDGSTIKTIANTAGDFSFLGVAPTINDCGTVAFLGGLDNGGAGYFTGDGTSLKTIANSAGPFDFLRMPTADNLFGEPAINNQGIVAFRADLDEGGKGIFIDKRGKYTAIADATEDRLSVFGLAPDINNRGTVVFSGGTVPINEGFQNTGIFTGRKGRLKVIADANSFLENDALTLFGSAPAINDREEIAFIAGSSTGEFGVFTGNAHSLVSVADSNGPIGFFRGVDINNAGTVAYLADFDIGGSGIFVENQPVIETGDILLGSTVVDLNFLNKGLNNQGEIAFWASLADGRSGIFRANPFPLSQDFWWA